MLTPPRHYHLLQLIGSGGFGTVYRARFEGEGGFSKEVALKVLNADAERVAEVASRLRDEARVLGLLRHRALVGVDRLVQLDGRWVVVMEYVDGESLQRLLKRGPLPPSVAIEIAGEVAGALHVAWTSPGPSGVPLRVLHRDIKPSNLQLTPHGEVKVLDFGIARAEFEAREAETRSVAYGTIEYMAPERLDMRPDGPEGDVYSLGVVLWEMLSGERFGRSSARQDRHATLLAERLEQARVLPGVDAATIELLGAMLAWSPADRPSAAQAERACLSIRSAYPGEPLRFWAERVLPLARREAAETRTSEVLVEGDLTGTMLVEGAEPASSTGPSEGRDVVEHVASWQVGRALLVLLLAGLGMTTAFGAAGVGVWLFLTAPAPHEPGASPPDDKAPVPPASENLAAEGSPGEAATPAVKPSPDPPPDPKPPPGDSRKKAPPRLVFPPASPPRTAPSAALVTLRGDVPSIRLSREDGSAPYTLTLDGAVEVPWGDYSIFWFDETKQGWRKLHELVVPRDRDSLVLSCSSAIRVCKELAVGAALNH